MGKFLKLKELAEVLGVSERHLYRQKAAGTFPQPVRIGRSLRWNADEVVKHFTECKNGKRNERGNK